MHNAFIDYTQTFDWVYRDKIIKCLNNYDIPSKLIKLKAKTLQDTKVTVKINQNYTEKFEILTGVKQATHCQQPSLAQSLMIFQTQR